MLDDRTGSVDMITAIQPHIGSDNEVIRCAAVRALETCGTDHRRRDILLALLRDQDPDVRSDAMDTLAPLALPSDAKTIRESLQGDPVREVKLAAIRTLARLRDMDSVDLLRALTRSKCEDRVAWEDDLGDWEDWLDIQIAAIDALGTMRATQTIEDLLAAMDDEMGQTLDIPVFGALSRMGRDGAIWLLASVQTQTGLTRQRAARALADSDPELLAEFVSELVKSDDPSVRMLALPHLPVDDAVAETFALSDPSPEVRCAGLRQFCGQRPDWAVRALADQNEAVQAGALNQLTLPLDDKVHEGLVDNCLAWLNAAGPELATAAASILPRIAPTRSQIPLVALARNTKRPIEIRLAAIEILTELDGADVSEHLADLLSDRAQQLRLGALNGLKNRALHGDAIALLTLESAIEQSLLDAGDRHQVLLTESAADVGVPKAEMGAGIRISPDGEIIRDDETGQSERSTLAAIQTSGEAAVVPAPVSPTRRKRVAIEGSDAVADDLARAAMDIGAFVGSVGIGSAIAGHLCSNAAALRTSAWRALSASFPDCAEIKTAARSAIDDDLPEVRRLALSVLKNTNMPWTEKALSDPDALIRAEAAPWVKGAQQLDLLNDRSAIVRRTALIAALKSEESGVAEKAVETVLQSQNVETLACGIRHSVAVRNECAQKLETAPARQAFVILEALAWEATQS